MKIKENEIIIDALNHGIAHLEFFLDRLDFLTKDIEEWTEEKAQNHLKQIEDTKRRIKIIEKLKNDFEI
jgi:hypothetical protein